MSCGACLTARVSLSNVGTPLGQASPKDKTIPVLQVSSKLRDTVPSVQFRRLCSESMDVEWQDSVGVKQAEDEGSRGGYDSFQFEDRLHSLFAVLPTSRGRVARAQSALAQTGRCSRLQRVVAPLDHPTSQGEVSCVIRRAGEMQMESNGWAIYVLRWWR